MKELNPFKKIYKDATTHHYSVSDFCIFGHSILKFNKSFSREVGPFTLFGFRINTKDGKIALMEVCFNDIENEERRRQSEELYKDYEPPKIDKDYWPPLPKHRGAAAELLLDHLETAKKNLVLDFYDECKEALHKFNRRTQNWIIEGMYNDEAIDEFFTDPSKVEEDKKELMRVVDYWLDMQTLIREENTPEFDDFWDR